MPESSDRPIEKFGVVNGENIAVERARIVEKTKYGDDWYHFKLIGKWHSDINLCGRDGGYKRLYDSCFLGDRVRIEYRVVHGTSKIIDIFRVALDKE